MRMDPERQTTCIGIAILLTLDSALSHANLAIFRSPMIQALSPRPILGSGVMVGDKPKSF